VRVLSGIQPSGDLHIGNYFGAIRQHVALQERYDETIYFCADYHSMTSTRSVEERRAFTRELAAGYLACGIDPVRSVLYRQSDVPETCELAWLLGTVTPLGLLQRGHAYKDKVAKGEKADFGLFAYPVLMAADILQFASDLVPVGRDQKQHVEFARDMAQSFNHTYGEVLKLPEPSILDDVAVVPGIDGEKMSKAYGNTIPLFGSDKQTKKAVMSIVTDSTPVEEPKKTDTPLFALWRLFASDEEREEMFSATGTSRRICSRACSAPSARSASATRSWWRGPTSSRTRCATVRAARGTWRSPSSRPAARPRGSAHCARRRWLACAAPPRRARRADPRSPRSRCRRR
jgi:tryptophanyl-tRNA synthetase